jgi:hypothetical protein
LWEIVKPDSTIGIKHELEPKSCDPDVGILASCTENEACVNGVCVGTEVDRQLQADFNCYPDGCDCSNWNETANIGSFNCTFGPYYNYCFPEISTCIDYTGFYFFERNEDGSGKWTEGIRLPPSDFLNEVFQITYFYDDISVFNKAGCEIYLQDTDQGNFSCDCVTNTEICGVYEGDSRQSNNATCPDGSEFLQFCDNPTWLEFLLVGQTNTPPPFSLAPTVTIETPAPVTFPAPVTAPVISETPAPVTVQAPVIPETTPPDAIPATVMPTASDISTSPLATGAPVGTFAPVSAMPAGSVPPATGVPVTTPAPNPTSGVTAVGAMTAVAAAILIALSLV